MTVFSPPGQLLHHPPLPLPKGRLAVLGEDVADGLPGARLDDVVGIQESEMHHVRRHPAHARLAGAHEPDQRKIMD